MVLGQQIRSGLTGGRILWQSFRFSSTSSGSDLADRSNKYDVVIVGAGHNGLTSAAYLARAGQKVCVLERRHLIGGAAVTEEIVPGFKFSRASYLLSLFRPVVMRDLDLKKHGLKYFIKDPSSFTPMLDSTRSLLLGSDERSNFEQIAQFSKKDAEAFPKFEHSLAKFSQVMDLLFDLEPIGVRRPLTLGERLDRLRHMIKTGKIVARLTPLEMVELTELLTAPIEKVLRKWFESEPLIATLATDGVIGAMYGPGSSGSGYVLLHHVMGELDGKVGAWAFVEGGMGSVSNAIAKAATEAGVDIYVNQPVDRILVDNGVAKGVKLTSGQEVMAKKAVLSNATPKVTFTDLLDEMVLPKTFLNNVKNIDYTSPVTKINVAVDKLPNFNSLPNRSDTPMPHHGTTVHLNCEDTQLIQDAYIDALQGTWSKRPVIEMTIPSSRDATIAPAGSHVVLLFTQYTPYQLADGRHWDDSSKAQYAKQVFSNIDEYCDGFSDSIVGHEVLSPVDLENIFGLTGGNIFHGSMSLDQLYFARPTVDAANYRGPIKNLYLCGSGGHPGGGVTGGPGRLAAMAVMKDFKIV